MSKIDDLIKYYNWKFDQDPEWAGPATADYNTLKEEIENDLDRLEKLEQKEKTSTLEEVIKEWEALGYEWSEYSSVIHLSHELLVGDETIIINKEDYSYYRLVNDSLEPIDLREHLLLTKTFKALGWFEDDN